MCPQGLEVHCPGPLLRTENPGDKAVASGRMGLRGAYGGVGLRDRERRLLPGEYDLDLDLDLDRERLLEERDLLRLL